MSKLIVFFWFSSVLNFPEEIYTRRFTEVLFVTVKSLSIEECIKET